MAGVRVFVILEHHISPRDAHLSRALLESEGIPAFLANEHHVSVNWPMSLVLGGVRVMVPAEHEAAARALFALRDDGTLAAALDVQDPQARWTCERCGASDLRNRLNWPSACLAVLLLLTLRVIHPVGKRSHCGACGAGA